MKADPKKLAVLFILISVLAIHAVPVRAYVLQGPHILDLTVKNIGQAESLFVSQKVMVFPIETDPESENPQTTGEALRKPADGWRRGGIPPNSIS